MANFTAVGLTETASSGSMNAGSVYVGFKEFTASSLHCSDIQTALNDEWATEYYPVDCDFVTLSQTGIVWFENPDTFGLKGLQVVSQSFLQASETFTDQQLLDLYSIETGFVVVSILLWSLMRQFRKLRYNFFS